MKLNKNNLQIIVLLISAFGLMLTMLSLLEQKSFINYIDSEFVLLLGIGLVSVTLFSYTITVIRRINPKKYIYLSYTGIDKGISENIIDLLSERLMKQSKYRFEFLTAETIPLGSNMYDVMKDNIDRSDIAIIIVSSAYLESVWCQKEFATITQYSKEIIPIVIETFSHLSQLPKDLSDIKALSLINCSADELTYKISILAKDLINRQKD